MGKEGRTRCTSGCFARSTLGTKDTPDIICFQASLFLLLLSLLRGSLNEEDIYAGDNITLLSTSAYPLHSPQSSLVLNPLPPLLIQQAAQSLNVSTTVNAPSTTATSRRRSQKVKIVQDASVYLISEAGDTAESFEGGGKPHVPESDRGEDFLKAWIVVLEMAVRLKSAPPLDRYAVSAFLIVLWRGIYPHVFFIRFRSRSLCRDVYQTHCCFI